MASLDMIPAKQMFALLQKCREQFAYYADNHHAKAKRFEHELTLVPADRDDVRDELRLAINETQQKAQVNEAMCRNIDNLIGEPAGTKPVRSSDNKLGDDI